ncbi:MAG: hypothetical protein WB799_19850 [Candidatus Sulfotelmatobacter sp.]
MARKTGQIVGRGRHRWLARVFLGRDRTTRRRHHHNRGRVNRNGSLGTIADLKKV